MYSGGPGLEVGRNLAATRKQMFNISGDPRNLGTCEARELN